MGAMVVLKRVMVMGDGNGGGPCALESPYICECEFFNEWTTLDQWVYGNPTAADNTCYSLCKERFNQVDAWKITPVACIEGAKSVDCSSWNPSASISHGDVSDHIYVDRELIEALTRDPEPLRSCDDAIFVRHTAGGYVVAGSSAGEMLYELGLRDGDLLQSINGYALNTPEDIAVAYTQLWSNGETEFLLDLERDNLRTQFHYTLVD